MSLPQELRSKYYKFRENRQVMSNPNMSHCPNLNCTEVLVKIDNNPFYCVRCQMFFCSRCLRVEHFGDCNLEEENRIVMNYNYKYL